RKAWSGDHCVDSSLVPGVLFCNHKLDGDTPSIMDIAPSVLDNFGIPIPRYMDGKILQIGDRPDQISNNCSPAPKK
ncbi:MAG: hypothetical protein R2860_17625, partial [Desulfobacterales bacterium]